MSSSYFLALEKEIESPWQQGGIQAIKRSEKQSHKTSTPKKKK